MSLTAKFKEAALGVSARFIFDRGIEFVGKTASPFSEKGDNDPEIFSGMMAAGSGFVRFAHHRETNTILMIASKTPVNLRGTRQEDGRILVDQEQLKRGYIISAYRLKPNRENERDVFQRLKLDAQIHFTTTAARSSKHFGVLSGAYTPDEHKPSKPSVGNNGELYINSAAVYDFYHKPGKDEYRADFHLAAHRETGDDGQERFSSFDPHNESGFLKPRIKRLSKNLAQGENRLEVREKLNAHLLQTLSKMWDEHDLYKGEGFGLRHLRARAVNYIHDHKKPVLISALSTGYLFSSYGVVAGMTSALAHTVGHVAFDVAAHQIADKSESVMQRVRRDMKRANIAEYGYTENCAAYFLVHTKDNLKRRNPKARPNIEGDLEFLTVDHLQSMVDHLTVTNGLQVESLRGLLLYAHQRGFPYKRMILDQRTQAESYASGMVVMRHERPDGKILIYGQYRPEACLGEAFRLPEVYVRQFGGGIVRYEYDRAAPNFGEGFKITKDLPYLDAVTEMQSLLFSPETHSAAYLKEMTPAIRFKSERCIGTVFRPPEEYKFPGLLPEHVASGYEDTLVEPAPMDIFDYTLPDIRAATTPNNFEENENESEPG